MSDTIDRTSDAPVGARNGRPGVRGAALSAISVVVPENRVPNAPIARRIGVDEKWIVKRTGVVERPHATDETVAQLSAEAARRTLESSGLAPEAVDLVLVATMTPDAITPNVAPMVIGELGLGTTAACDVGAACVGWLHAVSLAAGAVESGRSENVLVIGADFMSRVCDHYDRSVAALWADAAGCALVSRCAGGSRIGPLTLGTAPEGCRLIYASHEDGNVRMRGGETFGAAVDHLSNSTMLALEASDMTLEDVDLFAYHQANARIIRAVGERLDLPEEKVVNCVERYGNSSAATIPVALFEAERDGRLVPGTRVLMSTFGAGFTWGAGVVEWGLPAEA
ncbi:MAG TPA: ketoacyl-ACP synthase III [Thermoleophilaceae bacterium]